MGISLLLAPFGRGESGHDGSRLLSGLRAGEGFCLLVGGLGGPIVALGDPRMPAGHRGRGGTAFSPQRRFLGHLLHGCAAGAATDH